MWPSPLAGPALKVAACILLLAVAGAAMAAGPASPVAGRWEGQVWQSYGDNNGKIPKYYHVGTLVLVVNSLGHTEFSLDNECRGKGLAMPSLGGFVIDLRMAGCPLPEMNGQASAHMTKRGDFKAVIMKSPIAKTQTVGKLTMVKGGDEGSGHSPVDYRSPSRPLRIRDE
jgi:hypothetical protein